MSPSDTTFLGLYHHSNQSNSIKVQTAIALQSCHMQQEEKKNSTHQVSISSIKWHPSKTLKIVYAINADRQLTHVHTKRQRKSSSCPANSKIPWPRNGGSQPDFSRTSFKVRLPFLSSWPGCAQHCSSCTGCGHPGGSILDLPTLTTAAVHSPAGKSRQTKVRGRNFESNSVTSSLYW